LADIISKKTRQELREYFVGTTLRTIEMGFDAADVHCATEYSPGVSGARRALVEQYYHSLDFSVHEDARKFLHVYENVLSYLEESNFDSARTTFANLLKWIKKDGFTYQDGRLTSLGRVSGISELKSIAAEFGAPYLLQQIQTMEQAVDSDPRLAIGTAKELVETTSKTILSERGVPYDAGWDLVELVKRTRAELQLTPDHIAEKAKAAATVKRLLNNLATVVQGLAELRNPYGTGHGPDGRARGLQPRHARLAAGSAATLSTFLFETHRDRQAANSKASA
jgi:abortive infection Abi-like protein